MEDMSWILAEQTTAGQRAGVRHACPNDLQHEASTLLRWRTDRNDQQESAAAPDFSSKDASDNFHPSKRSRMRR